MQALGQKETHHVKVFGVMRSQPPRVGGRLFGRPRPLQLLRRGEKCGGCEEHGRSYGMIAVFRCPLWLIRCCMTSSKLVSGSTRFTNSFAVTQPRPITSSALRISAGVWWKLAMQVNSE